MSVDLSDISEARIDPSDVLGGGFSTELTEEEIKPHIGVANSVVQDRLVDKGLNERRLTQIEALLARHSIRAGPDRQVDSESIGPVSRDYSGDFAARELESTAPGQQAMMLDSSDTLGRQTIGFFSCNG
jgi:hypothetical protein